MTHHTSTDDSMDDFNLDFSQSMSVLVNDKDCSYQRNEGCSLDEVMDADWNVLTANVASLIGLEGARDIDRQMVAARHGEAFSQSYRIETANGIGSLETSLQPIVPFEEARHALVLLTMRYIDCHRILAGLERLGLCALVLENDATVSCANNIALRKLNKALADIEGCNFALDCLADDERVIDFIMAFEESRSYERPERLAGLKISRHVDARDSCEARILPLGKFFMLCILDDRVDDQVLLSELSNARNSEVVHRVSSAIARDFNNLFAIVEGNLRYLKSQSDVRNEAVVEAYEDAFSALSAANRLNERLLHFSAPESSPVARLDVVQHIVDFAKFSKVLFPPHFEIELVESNCEAIVDVAAAELESALLALLFNACDAIRYGEHGILRVMITTRTESGQRFVDINLKDNGPGMDEVVLERCFEPFFTTRPLGLGNGMGLPGVREFAHRYGGDCFISSVVGQGTSVTLTLPIEPAASLSGGVLPATSDSETIDPAEAQSHQEKNKRVLVLLVDDDDRVRKVARRDLQSLGLEVVEVESAEKALAVLEQSSRSIGLLISDVIMPPGIDGFQLRRKVLEMHPDLPVVLISGFSHVENAEEVPYLISKPYDLEHLRKVVEECLA